MNFSQGKSQVNTYQALTQKNDVAGDDCKSMDEQKMDTTSVSELCFKENNTNEKLQSNQIRIEELDNNDSHGENDMTDYSSLYLLYTEEWNINRISAAQVKKFKKSIRSSAPKNRSKKSKKTTRSKRTKKSIDYNLYSNSQRQMQSSNIHVRPMQPFNLEAYQPKNTNCQNRNTKKRSYKHFPANSQQYEQPTKRIKLNRKHNQSSLSQSSYFQ
eukprot:228972_1